MNSTFASFVQQMFGVRPMQGTSKQTSNSFMSVQAKPEGAPDNQVALSEAEKEKKKKDKEEAKKKRNQMLKQTSDSGPKMPALNNKAVAADLGTLKIGLSLNNASGTGQPNKKTSTPNGLNVPRY